jgi:spore coat protein A, manganese oxidase
MKFTRRQFIKGSLVTGAYVAAGGMGAIFKPRRAYAFSQSPQLAKFIQPLRKAVVDIPAAATDGFRYWKNGVVSNSSVAGANAVATHYTIGINQFTDQLHPALNPTKLWGYGTYGPGGQGDTSLFKHLGGIIATKRNTPVQITFQNNLPATHIIPVDTSIPGANQAQNRTAVHIHGGFVPWISDGGPFDWWAPDGTHGASFKNNAVLRNGNGPADGNEAEYYYPNGQGSRLVWYHDHAFGITRINAYAGIATGYVIYDDYEIGTGIGQLGRGGLPGPLDPRTIYLIFQDKIFYTGDNDPDYTKVVPGASPGDLWYAHVYDPTRWTKGSGPATPDPSVIAEFFGDTMLVNGSVYPYLEVEQRQYRFRILNACNARFVNAKLFYAKSNNLSSVLSKEENPSAPGPAFIQIASEGGFLPHPAMLNGTGQPRLLQAPAERADVIVDFRNVPANSVLILASNAPAPYPAGDALNDYSPTNFQTPSSKLGFGPNTRTLLQIRVKARVGNADAPITLPATFTPTDPFMIVQTPGVPIDHTLPITLANGSKVSPTIRYLTLNENFDGYGRLMQLVGTNAELVPGQGFGRAYTDTATEITNVGDYEIWEIINLTGDTHPMHFHLVNVQILSRQPFDAANFTGTPAYTGAPIAPDTNELGWKETTRINPGQVIRVFMKFDLPNVPFAVPTSDRAALLPYSPATNKKYHEYVWHCHILEHEEHDMMRPMVVVEDIPQPPV